MENPCKIFASINSFLKQLSPYAIIFQEAKGYLCCKDT